MASDDALTAAEAERRVATLVRERLPVSWKITDTFQPLFDSDRHDLSALGGTHLRGSPRSAPIWWSATTA